MRESISLSKGGFNCFRHTLANIMFFGPACGFFFLWVGVPEGGGEGLGLCPKSRTLDPSIVRLLDARRSTTRH